MQFCGVVILLLLLLSPALAVQIVEFCPDPYRAGDPDEYIVLQGTGSLDGIVVSDGEGGFRFPPSSRISGDITVARNGPAFTETHGCPPDYEWYDYSPAIPDVIRSGTLQLANNADQLLLYDQGRLIQEVAWPRDVAARQGQVHFLEDGRWDPRVLMIGQSRFSPAVFHGVGGVVFVSPDCSLAVYEEVVVSARNELLVNVYEFSSTRMVQLLSEASGRGVAVNVLLEGGPVGGISSEEKAAVIALQAAGIPVSVMASGNAAHPPYRFDHAKYLVIDRSQVLITSENFKSHGFPEAGRSGNRGWGIVLEDAGLAGYFASVYAHDATGGWCNEPSFASGDDENTWAEPYRVEFSPYRFSDATVIPVLSPDTSYLISGMIRNASESVDIEQAYITNASDGTFNPFLLESIDAARRGVRVRILLDSYYYNVDGPEDNDEMVWILNALAAREKIRLEARCADLSGNNLVKIHNKGVIVDRQWTLVSSINWNDNSPTFNREAGVIIDHHGVAGYLTQVFEDDWEGSVNQGPQRGPDRIRLALAALVLIALAILAYRRRRRWF